MNDEEPLVVFTDNALPLFADRYVRIVCMAVFSWDSLKHFSYFPIIIQPPNFKNLYVSLCMHEEDELKHFLNPIFEKEITYQKNQGNILHFDDIEYLSIDRFDPLQYDENTTTFLFLKDDGNSSAFSFNLAKFSQEILNPLGIGVFYSTQFSFAKPVKNGKSLKQYKYYQAPFSMEIVDRLFYAPYISSIVKDKAINIIDSISFLNLKYPLRPLNVPMIEDDFLRRKTIFSRITLENPPSYSSNNLSDYKIGSLINPFTWIIVELEKKVSNPIFAVILETSKEEKNGSLTLENINKEDILNINPWNSEAKHVLVQFKNQKAMILSPYKGILKIYCKDDSFQYKENEIAAKIFHY